MSMPPIVFAENRVRASDNFGKWSDTDLQLSCKNQIKFSMLFRKSNEMDSRIWSGFHRKTIQERQQVLKLSFPNLFAVDDDGDDGATPHGFPMARPLPITVADQMVENCIG